VGPALATIALLRLRSAIWVLLRSSAARRLVAGTVSRPLALRETPSLGGIGIFFGFSVGLWGAVATGTFSPSEAFIASTAVRRLRRRLADDLFNLGPLAKLAAQGAARS